MSETTQPLSAEQLECLRGCSQYSQYFSGRKSFETGSCPFCTIDHTQNKVRYKNNTWIAWEVPASFTTRQSTLALQIVLFPKRHLRRPPELDKEERLGYFDVIDWAHQAYDIPGGAIINRIGDMRYNVGTIMHMHATIMMPNRNGSVTIPLQKEPALWQEHDARMRGFAARYEAGEIPPST